MKIHLMPALMSSLILFASLGHCVEPLTMDIVTYDFVPGELSLGAGAQFKLVIQNNTGTVIKLSIAGDSFYYDSPCWKLTVNGPLDPKCVIPPDMILRMAHNPTELKVLPGTNKFRGSPGAKVGEPGSYSISIEYDGTTAPEGCYRGKLRTPERTYTVKPLLGADAELYAAWKKQNPARSICFFPLGMQPNVLKPDVLIENYPLSTLAGWALLDYSPDGPGVFVKNATAEKAIMAAINKDAQEMRRLWKLDRPIRLGEKWVERAPEMKKVMQAGDAFSRAHPDFLFAGYVLAKAGFNALGLGDIQNACKMFKDALKLPWHAPRGPDNALEPNKEGTKNALDILTSQGYCKN